MGHLPAVRLLGLPDRRVLGAGPGPELLDHDPAAAVVDGDRLVRRPGAGPQPAPGAGAEAVRARQLHAARQAHVLVDAGDGDARGGDVPDRRPRGVAVPQARRCTRRAGSSGSRSSRSRSRTSPRPPAGSSPRWAASRGSCRTCSRPPTPSRRTSARPRSRRASACSWLLYLALGRRRLRPDAPLRARWTRPQVAAGRAGLRRRHSAPEPGEMGLEEFWFVLIAVLWGGYFLLEGFDFGVGMLLPVLPRDEREREHDVRVDRAGVGRQRGLARGRRRRDVRRVPGLVRDDVLRLLHRAAADPRAADRPRGLVRVAREARRLALAERPGCGRTRSGASAPRSSGGSRSSNLVARRAAGLLARVHRQRPRPVQRLHGRRRARGGGDLRGPRRDVPDTAHVRRLLRASGRDGAGGCRCPPRSSASRSSPGPSSSPTIATAGASSRRPSRGADRARADRRRRAHARPPQRLGVRGDRRWPRSASSRRSSPACIRACSSRIPTFANSLTISNAAAGHYALQVITIVAAIFTPLVLLYQSWTYYVFRRRLGGEPPPAGPARDLPAGG